MTHTKLERELENEILFHREMPAERQPADCYGSLRGTLSAALGGFGGTEVMKDR